MHLYAHKMIKYAILKTITKICEDMEKKKPTNINLLVCGK